MQHESNLSPRTDRQWQLTLASIMQVNSVLFAIRCQRCNMYITDKDYVACDKHD